MHAHLDTERHLAKLAAEDPTFTYTSIREGLYAESTGMYTASFDPRQPDGGEIRIPHDGSGPGISWVKLDELGEASAKLIASYAKDSEGFPFVNGKVLLTGSRAWSLAETAELLSKIAGREIKIKQVSLDEYLKLPKELEKFGSEEVARMWATSWDAIRAGETAVVTPELKKILGREPESFDVTVREYFA